MGNDQSEIDRGKVLSVAFARDAPTQRTDAQQAQNADIRTAKKDLYVGRIRGNLRQGNDLLRRRTTYVSLIGRTSIGGEKGAELCGELEIELESGEEFAID
jgi:hypothetical protein